MQSISLGFLGPNKRSAKDPCDIIHYITVGKRIILINIRARVAASLKSHACGIMPTYAA